MKIKHLKSLIFSVCASLCICSPAYADEDQSIRRKISFVEDTEITDTEEVTEPVSEETEETEQEEPVEPEYVYLGNFRLTAYCRCRKCNGSYAGKPTASMTDYVEGRTVAVDPKVIPLGTYIEINIPGEGWHEYHAEDTGNAVKGKHIDIFVEGHPNCLQDRYNTSCEVRSELPGH